MNTFRFVFSYSIWFIIVLGILNLMLTFFFYKRTNPKLATNWKILLFSSRFLAILLLSLLLIEPLMSIIQNHIQPPKIAVLTDNSKSMNFHYGKINKKNQIRNIFLNSNILNFHRYPISFWTFGKTVKHYEKFDIDSLNLNEEETNLSNALQRIQNLKDEGNIQALILVTDGIINAGENPIPIATRLGIPITTIAIGDTSTPKDVAITNIITNEEAFVAKEQIVKANIKSSGFQGKLKITFFEENSLLEEKTIDLSPNVEDYSVFFTYKPAVEGYRKLSVRADLLPSEFTSLNNQQNIIVKVRKNKNKFVIFSGYPNPDVAYISRIITSQEGNNLKLFIQKKDGEFYNSQPTKQDIEESNVLVLIAFPISSTPEYLMELIAQNIAKGKSLLFLSGLETDYRRLKPIEYFLPFSVISNKTNEFTFTADFSPTLLGKPFIFSGDEKDLELLNQLPPIFRTELYTRAKPESEILSTIKVNNVAINEPFLLLRDFQNQRTVALLGYGIYRWQLLGFSVKEINNPNQTNIDVGSTVLTNIINWLTITQEHKKVKFNLSKNKFTSNEKVVITAQVFDETFSSINNALVKLTIRGKDNKNEFTLNQIGNGLYYTEISSLPEGDYTFEGEAIWKNTILGKEKGRFSVEKANFEYLDFRSKYEFLLYISKQSNGEFFAWNQTDLFSNYLHNLNLKSLIFSKQKDYPLWNNPILMLIIILLFSIEWLIRRKLGLI